MSCVHCRPPRLRRRDVLLSLARDARYHYLHFTLRLASDLLEAARVAGPDEREALRELARTLRAGARFAQGGAA